MLESKWIICCGFVGSEGSVGWWRRRRGYRESERFAGWRMCEMVGMTSHKKGVSGRGEMRTPV